ncbi:GNAT family N-acetyltransferase [Pseudoduganella sp. FT25W]|uniref:GNAT family N-acetyltransferase n=1 Tax=Duganella alba TaxID=2666081 RepID=A0A6L5QPQ0_9BURK|nr:GNAT family N-acetyltransferase [Duganella alba]MRX11655.1 GNAT family N-acetyltransferase [Duganella alba]MRX20086.1 GNAT family N-acetyltransferase [Duganella alba]
MPALHISTDKAALDVAMIHQFLSERSTWAIGIPLVTVQRAIDNSLCFGAYLDGRQVGFARVTTDRATFAYLADVFVLEAQRGKGVSKEMMTAVMAHPELQGLRRFMLATSDAHSLYAGYGFTPPARPASLMERYFPDIYAN